MFCNTFNLLNKIRQHNLIRNMIHCIHRKQQQHKIWWRIRDSENADDVIYRLQQFSHLDITKHGTDNMGSNKFVRK